MLNHYNEIQASWACPFFILQSALIPFLTPTIFLLRPHELFTFPLCYSYISSSLRLRNVYVNYTLYSNVLLHVFVHTMPTYYTTKFTTLNPEPRILSQTRIQN
jgi:hypothetical protein